MPAMQAVHELREPGMHQRFRHAQAEEATYGAGLPRGSEHLAAHRKDAPSVRQQLLALFSEAYAARAAVEEPDVQRGFQAGNALGNGRLGRVQLFSSHAEVAHFGHPDEGFDLLEVHDTASTGCNPEGCTMENFARRWPFGLIAGRARFPAPLQDIRIHGSAMRHRWLAQRR